MTAGAPGPQTPQPVGLRDARKIIFDLLDTQPVEERAHTRNLCHLEGEVDLAAEPERWPRREWPGRYHPSFAHG